MKPVKQTNISIPGGNCFQACVASILELPLESVLDFVNQGPQEKWFYRLADWLVKRDYGVVYSPFEPICATIQGFCILGIQTERHVKEQQDENWVHAVVGRANWTLQENNEKWIGFEVVHDPHPNPSPMVQIRDVTWIVSQNLTKELKHKEFMNEFRNKHDE